MTKEEIIRQLSWDEYGTGSCTIHTPLFGQQIKFNFYSEKKEITDKMVACTNDVLQLPASDLIRVKELIWEDCLFCFETFEHGYPPQEDEDQIESNKRGYKIYNQEDAYLNSTVTQVYIDFKNDTLTGRFAGISIDTAWDYLTIVVKDGRIIDCYSPDPHMKWFDRNEQYGANERRKELIKRI